MLDPKAGFRTFQSTVDPNSRYYEQLGSLIFQFATVELLVHLLFRYVTGMDYASGRILSAVTLLTKLIAMP